MDEAAITARINAINVTIHHLAEAQRGQMVAFHYDEIKKLSEIVVQMATMVHVVKATTSALGALSCKADAKVAE